MPFDITTHKLDTQRQECVLEIYDTANNVVVCGRCNFGLALNPDGSANTDWITAVVKAKIKEYKKDQKFNSVPDIVIDISSV